MAGRGLSDNVWRDDATLEDKSSIGKQVTYNFHTFSLLTIITLMVDIFLTNKINILFIGSRKVSTCFTVFQTLHSTMFRGRPEQPDDWE